MLKLTVGNATLTAGNTIPISISDIYDRRYYVNNNTVYIREPQNVEIIGNVTITATATGPIGINVVEDGNVVATYSAVAAAVGDVITIPVYELFRVIPANILNGYANVSFTVANDVTVSSGIISFKYIR